MKTSARNQLAGTVSHIERGAVATVARLVLPGGEDVTCTVTSDAVDDLQRRIGQQASAIFKA